MGIHRTYKCSDCNYAFFGSGGRDRGFIATTQTFECTECKILFDATIALDTSDRNKKTTSRKREEYFCPQCKSKEHLQMWDYKVDQRCPKANCKGTMEYERKEQAIFWD